MMKNCVCGKHKDLSSERNWTGGVEKPTLWFRAPTHCPTHGQWWSYFKTHCREARQCRSMSFAFASPRHSPIRMLDNGVSCTASGIRPSGNTCSLGGVPASWKACACTSKTFVLPQQQAMSAALHGPALWEPGYRWRHPSSRGSETVGVCLSHRRSLRPLAVHRHGGSGEL